MNNVTLKSYLEGSVNANFEDQACHTLAAEGPQIVVPTLRMILPFLKSWGEQLAIIFMRPSDWPSQLTGLEYNEAKSIVEKKVGLRIDNTFFRVQRLLREIAHSSSQNGKIVGEQVRLALTDRDADLRVLATVHSIADGIPSHIVLGSLLRLLYDDDPLAKYGAAAGLFGFPDIPENDKPQAVILVRSLLYDVAYPSFPMLADKVQSNFGQNEPYKIMVFAILTVYRLLALRLFDEGSGSFSAWLDHLLS